MLYGVSYYPEQKTKEELEQDLTLIKQSGINTVRMGEFADISARIVAILA